MHCVLLSPYVPFREIDHAGGAYLDAYVRRAALSREIELFAPRSSENEQAAERHDSRATIHLVDVEREPATGTGRRWWNVRNFAKGLTPGWQVLAGMRNDRALRAAVEECDRLEVHWNYMLPVLQDLSLPPDRPVAVFPHDVVAQTFARRAALPDTGWRRAPMTLLAHRVRRQEVRLLGKADVVFVFSDKDVDLLRRAGLNQDVQVLDPLVETPAVPAPLSGSSTLLFVGAMHRPENIDAIHWFLSTAWPLVRQAVPGAQLVVAGSSPPADLAAGVDGVTVTGFVADFAPLYAASRGAVVPLRAGAGLKFKVAQAMLWGLPVVTTSVGAEGIVQESGRECFAAVSDTEADLAAACIRVLTDDALALAVGARARLWASDTYDTNRSIDQALAVMDRLVIAARS